MKRASIRQITVGLAIALSVLIVNAAISYGNILRLIENEQQVSHSHRVLATLKETLSTVKDAQLRQRGYLLTGKELYMELYYTDIQKVWKQVSILRQLTAGNARQQQRIQQLEQAIGSKLADLKETLELRQNQQMDAALQVVRIDRGKQLMDRIRDQVAVMEAEENQLLQQRSESSKSSAASTLFTFTLAIGLDVLLLLIIYYIIRRHEAKRHHEAQVQHELIIELQRSAAELSQLNEALTQTSSQLVERNLELDRFTYTVSHDLKAPLRAIANLSQWISEDLEGQINEENQRHMDLLRSRVRRMETLIQGLLTYSRIGRTEIATERVNVGELISEILDSLAPPASFTIFVQPDMPTLLTRRLLLSQVFSNLISNAIKHGDRPDTRIEIRATQKGEYYEFSVADNGRGIAPENHDRLFGIFQTLKKGDTQESTGIGLSIVKKILETEGGCIFLESELGKGATFRFTWLIQPLGIAEGG